MKHNWRIFELILSGTQICCGFLILFSVYLTVIEYFAILWINPLMDHNTIIEVAVRKNLTLVIISFFSILSALFLIKNMIKGWVMSVITWIMFTITLLINSYRLNQRNPNELDLVSKFIIGFMIVVSIAIITVLNNTEFMQKYRPTKRDWITIAISIFTLSATKFI